MTETELRELKGQLEVAQVMLDDSETLRAAERESSAIVAVGFKQSLDERDEFARLSARHQELREQAEATCVRRTAERDEIKAKAHDLAMRLITAECALADEQAAHAKTLAPRPGEITWLAPVIDCPLELLGPCEAGDRGRHVHMVDEVVYDSEPDDARRELMASQHGVFERLAKGPGAPATDDHAGCSPTSHCGSCEHAENDS